jgi:hypothetical protein
MTKPACPGIAERVRGHSTNVVRLFPRKIDTLKAT